MNSVKLMNPHSVLAALHSRPHDVMEIHASRRRAQDAWADVINLAHAQGVSIKEPLQRGRRQGSPQDGGRVGTRFGIIREKPAVPLEEFFADPATRGLWLAFDRIQDPHNVGAIFRTASFFGIKGILLTQDKSAPMSGTVYDVASGGVESVPYLVQTNLVRAIQLAKEQEMWVLGSSEHAELPLTEIDRNRRWLLVLGNEEKGLRRLTLENCDQTCRIPAQGSITSLNVSVAAGILMAALTS